MDFKEKLETNTWETNLDEVVATIKELTKKDSTWSWVYAKSFDYKYIELRIDMRDGAFVIRSGGGSGRDQSKMQRISLEDLKHQKEY